MYICVAGAEDVLTSSGLQNLFAASADLEELYFEPEGDRCKVGKAFAPSKVVRSEGLHLDDTLEEAARIDVVYGDASARGRSFHRRTQ